MFLKSLGIHTGDGRPIREILFHAGLNLIVDQTPSVSGQESGNNVGKTTVLKLIDFCLGGDPKDIYCDTENKKNEYKLVKDFLVENRVVISLVLTDDLAAPGARETLIQRNFPSRKEKIQRINSKDLIDDDFDAALTDLLFPGHYPRKPTFRQIISHNIRHKEASVTNMLRTLHTSTRDVEYETLYLFLLGCDYTHGDAKQMVRAKIDLEEKFRRRLQSAQTKSTYETTLALLNGEITELERKRSAFNINPAFEADMEQLNVVRYHISVTTSEIGRLELRRNLITEAQTEMARDESKIDLQQLRMLYAQATSLVEGIQKTFDQLHDFHNRMVAEKIRYVASELPSLNIAIERERAHLANLLSQEKELAAAVSKTDSFGELERLVVELNDKFRQKGEYENIIRQLNEVDAKLDEYNAELAAIDKEIFSDDFAQGLRKRIYKFNQHFSAVSQQLYGEKYALKFETKEIKGRQLYEFTAFNTNFSSGKKQGEISCFDIAYTLFADDEGIPCMHFLLNDKKELMHDNQLLMIARLVEARNIQFVASILEDKLPKELRTEDNIILRLSPTDKLFRIEQAG
ncbi:MAG: DUF2326 domain-containing protein [Verrucomicrobia bacterium]|nr:DUF2326 domain-containing protein [Verrucomicrobiota bacterium]